MCVDYRRLNSVSRDDAYPMPRIDNLINRLREARFITTMDLTRGYWQMPVAKEDQHKTAFVTPFGLFQFKVMPFGLNGAPASFQCMTDRVVDGLQELCSGLPGRLHYLQHYVGGSSGACACYPPEAERSWFDCETSKVSVWHGVLRIPWTHGWWWYGSARGEEGGDGKHVCYTGN